MLTPQYIQVCVNKTIGYTITITQMPTMRKLKVLTFSNSAQFVVWQTFLSILQMVNYSYEAYFINILSCFTQSYFRTRRIFIYYLQFNYYTEVSHRNIKGLYWYIPGMVKKDWKCRFLTIF